MNYYVSLGAPPEKLVVGMPMYGRGYKIANNGHHDIGTPSSGRTPPNKYTRENGVYSYYEVQVRWSYVCVR